MLSPHTSLSPKFFIHHLLPKKNFHSSISDENAIYKRNNSKHAHLHHKHHKQRHTPSYSVPMTSPAWLQPTIETSIKYYAEALSSCENLEQLNMVKRLLCKGDLFYLMAYQLNRPDVIHPWIFDRCREVQAQPDGHLDLWSRDAYKSTLITFGLTIKDILNDPEDTICLFSHTKGNAKKFLRQIKREFEINRGLQELFPDILYAEPDKQSPLWSEDSGLVVQRKGNPKEPTLKASGLVDGQQTGDHFKKRIYDDTVTQDSVTTPDQIAKTTEGWEMSISLGTRDGIERYIGTRYSLHDTYAEMMKRGAVNPRIYAATHNGRMDGKPVLFSPQVWASKLKKLSRFNIASQYLQNPLADEDATFSSLWLKQWETRPRTVNIYILGDPNRKIGADNDNCAFIVIAVSSAGGKYLVDGYRHQMTQSQRWTALRDLYRRWSAEKGVQQIYVGYEKYGAEQDLDYFEERQMEEGIIFPIEKLSWTREGTSGQQGKRYRVERLEPDFRNGRFYLPLAIWHKGEACTWKVDSEPLSKTFRNVIWQPLTGFTKQQLTALNGGSEDLICKAIKRVDENGRVYDVTDKFIEEYLNFPFGEYKDAIDAASRLYDMEYLAAEIINTKDGEPPQYFDS